MKKLLLTGASGFIGRHTIPFLIKRGYEVNAIFNTTKPDINEDKDLFWHKCNLLNLDEQKKLIAKIKPSHLLHFAWYTIPGKYLQSIENFRWVQASLELLVNFVENGGKRAVFAGTCAEYDRSYGNCSEKSTPLTPSTLYGTSKNSLHEMLRQFSSQTDLSYAWGRVFFLYGPYEYPDRLVASFICSLLKDQIAHCLYGDLIRDFLHVQDVASAFVSLLESNVSGPVNIASGNPIALRDIGNTIADKLNKRELVRLGEDKAPVNEPKLLVADVKRLNSEVGWIPNYVLDQGIKADYRLVEKSKRN